MGFCRTTGHGAQLSVLHCSDEAQGLSGHGDAEGHPGTTDARSWWYRVAAQLPHTLDNRLQGRLQPAWVAGEVSTAGPYYQLLCAGRQVGRKFLFKHWSNQVQAIKDVPRIYR